MIEGSSHAARYVICPSAVAEFRSVVKDSKSNTKNITKSISIHSDYQSVLLGKCLCLAFSSLRKIWTPELLRITKKKKQNKKTKQNKTKQQQKQKKNLVGRY